MNCQNGGSCKKLCNNNDCEICFTPFYISNADFYINLFFIN